MDTQTTLEEPIRGSDHFAFLMKIKKIKIMTRRRYQFLNRQIFTRIAEEALTAVVSPQDFLMKFETEKQKREREIVRYNKLPMMTAYQKEAFKILQYSESTTQYIEETREMWKTLTEDIIKNRNITPKAFWRYATRCKGYRKRSSIVRTITAPSCIKEGEDLNRELYNQVKEYHLGTDMEEMISAPRFQTLVTHPELLSSGKALGPDLIPDDIVKVIINKGINLNWLQDPDTYKHLAARICLLNKTQNLAPTLMDTRPIAIQSVIFKIVESALIPTMRRINNQMTSEMQFGFKDNLSTHIPQNLLFKRIIRETLNKDCKTSITIFIDLKKAYDSVYRGVILDTLRHKLTEEEFKLLTMIYALNKFKIGDKEVHPNRGLMQGSVLSPHLFNVIIDPLIRRINNTLFATAFADDLAGQANNVSQIRKLWNDIKEWGENTGVDVNPNKCAIIIHKATAKDRKLIKTFAEENKIPIVSHYKYLGTILARRATGRAILSELEAEQCSER